MSSLDSSPTSLGRVLHTDPAPRSPVSPPRLREADSSPECHPPRRDGLSTRPEAECPEQASEAETCKAVRLLQGLAGPQPTARKPAAHPWFAGGAPSSLRMCWRRGRGAPRDSGRARRAPEGTPGHDSSLSILPAPTASWSSFLPSSHPPETLGVPKGWALGSLWGGPAGASPATESMSLCPDNPEPEGAQATVQDPRSPTRVTPQWEDVKTTNSRSQQ